MGVRKVSDNKIDLQGHLRVLAMAMQGWKNLGF